MGALHLVTGTVLAVAAISASLLNLSILVTIIRGELWKSSNFFTFAAAVILNDFLFSILFVGYIGPSIILQTYFFETGLDSPLLQILSNVALFFWLVEGILQVVICLHRVLVVKYSIDLKRFIIVSFATLPFVLASIVVFVACNMFDSRGLLVDWKHFGFSLRSHLLETSAFNLAVLLPTAIVPFILSAILYSVIGYHLQSTQKAVQPFLIQVQVRKREKRFTMEYIFIIVFNLIAWILFLLTQSVPAEYQPDWLFAVYPAYLMIKLQIPAFILLKYNNEIRLKVFKKFIDNRLPPVLISKNVTTTPVQMLSRNQTF